MKGKTKKKSKFTQCMRGVLKYVRKGCDTYTNIMMDCAGNNYYSHVVCPAPQLPQWHGNQSVNPTIGIGNGNGIGIGIGIGNDQGLKELLRIVSKRADIGIGLKATFELRKDEGKLVMGANGVGRSYSVRGGKMGRIDEEKPCEFEEVKVEGKKIEQMLNLNSRGTGYAIRRKGFKVRC